MGAFEALARDEDGAGETADMAAGEEAAVEDAPGEEAAGGKDAVDEDAVEEDGKAGDTVADNSEPAARFACATAASAAWGWADEGSAATSATDVTGCTRAAKVSS